MQRLGPHVEDVEPVVVRPGDQVDRDELVARLVAGGYRREYQVEARGEVAVRGSIVDVYPSTDDHPVRIDLWGDEVDRLSAFSVADQRSTHDVDEACDLPDPRAAAHRRGPRARRRARAREQPWGREQWERLAEGQMFDGMESWLPWLADREHLLPDLLADDALVLLVEPRRMRDRAQELLDEEASLAATLAITWGASDDDELPRLSLAVRPAARAHQRRRGVGAADARRSRHAAASPATAFDPVVGDTDALAAAPARARAARATASCSRPRAPVGAAARRGARRRRARRRSTGDPAPGAVDSSSRRSTAAWCCRARSSRSSPKPTSPAAAACTAAARGARRGADYYEDLEPGDYVVHHQHGVGRYLEMKPLDDGRRRARLPAGSSSRRRQGLRAHRPGRHRAQVHRRRDAVAATAWAAPTSRSSEPACAARSREIAEELVVLYRQRLATPGHAFAPDTPWQHEIEEAFPYEETPDQLQAITT